MPGNPIPIWWKGIGWNHIISYWKHPFLSTKWKMFNCSKILKKFELLYFTVISSNPVNLIQAVFKFCVEHLIACQKCHAIACRAIAIQAVHPHSTKCPSCSLIFVNSVVEWTHYKYQLDGERGSTGRITTEQNMIGQQIFGENDLLSKKLR
jgi:hypothetical protein